MSDCTTGFAFSIASIHQNRAVLDIYYMKHYSGVALPITGRLKTQDSQKLRNIEKIQKRVEAQPITNYPTPPRNKTPALVVKFNLKTNLIVRCPEAEHPNYKVVIKLKPCAGILPPTPILTLNIIQTLTGGNCPDPSLNTFVYDAIKLITSLRLFELERGYFQV